MRLDFLFPLILPMIYSFAKTLPIKNNPTTTPLPSLPATTMPTPTTQPMSRKFRNFQIEVTSSTQRSTMKSKHLQYAELPRPKPITKEHIQQEFNEAARN